MDTFNPDCKNNLRGVKKMNLLNERIDRYILSLLNVEYIDFENSEIHNDGTIDIYLNKNKLPKLDFEIDDNDDNWILGQLELCEEVFIQIDTNIGIITGLFVEGFTVIHMFVDTFLNSEYAEQIDTYIDYIKKWCAKISHTDT